MRLSVKRAFFSSVSKKERFFEYKNVSVGTSDFLRLLGARNSKRIQGLLRQVVKVKCLFHLDDFPHKIDLFLGGRLRRIAYGTQNLEEIIVVVGPKSQV